jgi:hypothetical protein
MPRPADPHKQQQWLQHIRLWQASRLSVREYCDCHQLSEATCYCWKRTLQQRGVLTGTVASNGLPPHAHTGGRAPLFLPVTISATDRAAV